ncbi:MAG: ParB N-terminal domain-containing protein [Planctomycetota bacterium]|nr:ParB N-terminal domain-containing protein [Planctomycetota bacterium]
MSDDKTAVILKAKDVEVEVHCAFTKLVKTKDVVPYPKNANQHSARQVELLALLIGGNRKEKTKGNGWRVPITVSNQSGFVVRGHGRLEAAKKLGLKDVPVDFQDYETPELEKADRLADNQIPELAEIDQSILKGEFEDLIDLDFDMELTGFDEKEIAELITIPGDSGDKPEKPTIIKGGGLEALKPSEEERAILDGKQFLVEFSGGKDSTAAAAWCRFYYPNSPMILMFVDLGADWVGFETHVHRSAAQLGGELVVLRSKENILDQLLKRKAWPHFGHPWCHDLLHGTLDGYVAEFPAEEVVIVRGGRVSEKAARSKANPARWLTMGRLPDYRCFQPLYFADKGTAERVMKTSGLDFWEGYSRGLNRTACRICPGQNSSVYAAIRKKFPDVWRELKELENHCAGDFWYPITVDGIQRKLKIEEMADHGDALISARNPS